MWLIVIAGLGLSAPGGLFLYGLFHDHATVSAALSDHMALALFLDLAMSTFLFGWFFAQRPVGPLRWGWFVALSFLSTLAFAIPVYLWLNWRLTAAPRPRFTTWMRMTR
jgi:hypothetical protein